MNTEIQEVQLDKYSAYKDSGVEWLGDIPEHWGVKRIKYLFNEINERSDDGSEDLLSVSQYTGVTNKSDKHEEGGMLTNASTLEGYKKVKKGDLVSNIMLAWNGSLGFSPFDGITSPAYSVYRTYGNNYNRYFHYLLRTELYKAEYKRNSSGVIESRLRLYTDDFFNIESFVPPLPEQTAIANFLDDRCSKIDAAVEIKQQQIALLKERRQIAIHQAITQGLDKNVPMKDSGVEWIGEIPAHWEVKKIKNVTKKVGSGVTPSGGGTTYLETGIPLLRSQNIYFDRIELKGVAYISEQTHELMNNSKVLKGDVLLNITGGSIGRCCYIDIDFPLNVNQHVCILRPNKKITTLYLNKLLASEVGQNQIWFHQQGGGREGLNFQALKNFSIPYPSLHEQKEISEYLECLTTKIDTAIFIKQQEIEKLKEYKTTLINSAVTGKIKIY